MKIKDYINYLRKVQRKYPDANIVTTQDVLTDEDCLVFRRLPCNFNGMVRSIYSAGVRAEQDRCCGIVLGQCSSDNEAQRTVNAIRSKELVSS